MNFNPQNTQTLENLVAALGQGLSGSTGYSILQDTMQQQAAQNQMRQQRYQDQAQQLLGAAAGGLPYGAARGLADLITPRQGIPGKVQGMLTDLYPSSDPPLNVNGQVPDYYNPPEGVGQQAQSPMFTQDPIQQMQIQQQQLQMAQAMAPPQPSVSQQNNDSLALVTQAIQNGLSQGMDPAQIDQIMKSDPGYAAVYVQNLQKLVLAFPQMQAVLQAGA